ERSSPSSSDADGRAPAGRRRLEARVAGSARCRQQTARRFPSGCASTGQNAGRRKRASRVPHRAAIVLNTVMAAALAVFVTAVSAAAQTPATAPPDRPGPYVIDIRGVTVGAPKGAAFYPPV